MRGGIYPHSAVYLGIDFLNLQHGNMVSSVDMYSDRLLRRPKDTALVESVRTRPYGAVTLETDSFNPQLDPQLAIGTDIAPQIESDPILRRALADSNTRRRSVADEGDDSSPSPEDIFKAYKLYYYRAELSPPEVPKLGLDQIASRIESLVPQIEAAYTVASNS